MVRKMKLFLCFLPILFGCTCQDGIPVVSGNKQRTDESAQLSSERCSLMPMPDPDVHSRASWEQ